MKNLLFVCRANVDRSPAAEAIARHYLRSAGLDSEISVSSAGIEVPLTIGMRGLMQGELAQRNIRIGKHMPRQIEETIIDNSSLILCMNKSQVYELNERYRDCSGKILSLGEYSGYNEEIINPERIIKEFDFPYLLPGIIKRPLRRAQGLLHPTDLKGIKEVYRRLLDVLCLHVLKSLRRFSDESHIRYDPSHLVNKVK